METIDDEQIQIVSGNNDQVTIQVYTGKRSKQAILRRLNKERWGGYKWAMAIQFHAETCGNGDVFCNLETGIFCYGKRI